MRKKLYIKGFLIVIFFCICGVTYSCNKTDTFILSNKSQKNNSNDTTESDDVFRDSLKGEGKNPEGEDVSGIYVHISGAVVNPGVYKAEPSMRLFQLIDMAGGFTDEADSDFLNLAQMVADGQQIYVYTKEETESMESLTDSQDYYKMGHDQSGSALININKASVEELMTLQGIGKTRAESIVAYREEHGGFKTIEEIMNVSGIKEAAFLKIKDDICTN